MSNMKFYALFADNGTRDTLAGIFLSPRKALEALQDKTVGWRDDDDELIGDKRSWTLAQLERVHQDPFICELTAEELECLDLELHEWDTPGIQLSNDDPRLGRYADEVSSEEE